MLVQQGCQHYFLLPTVAFSKRLTSMLLPNRLFSSDSAIHFLGVSESSSLAGIILVTKYGLAWCPPNEDQIQERPVSSLVRRTEARFSAHNDPIWAACRHHLQFNSLILYFMFHFRKFRSSVRIPDGIYKNLIWLLSFHINVRI